MTRAMPALVKKEIRALWPAWAIAMMLMLVFAPGRQWQGLAIGAYMLGAAALGALCVGLDYGHRTIGLMLSQPVRREHMLLAKLSVLAPMLLTLGAVAGEVLFRRAGSLFGSDAPSPERLGGLAAVLLPMVAALFLSPWLTMICRSPIAGTVFTIALPGLLTGFVFVTFAFVFRGPIAREAEPVVLIGCVLGLLAVAAVMSWRTFMRLEAIDGGGEDLRLPSWLGRRTSATSAAPVPRKRNPFWLLIKKELSLQQTTILAGALYLLAWLLVTSMAPQFVTPFNALTLFYALMVSLLAGSLASAEERQLGTLEWQVLQPVATSKQWTVKVGVTLGLALVLALGLPVLLARLNPSWANWFEPQRFLHPGDEYVLAVIALTVGSLYVSSLTSNGLWALLISLPVLAMALLGLDLIYDTIGSPRFWLGDTPRASTTEASFMSVIGWLLRAGLVGLVAHAARLNHQSVDRGLVLVGRRIAWVAVPLIVGLALLSAIDHLIARALSVV